jgi:hypothetical protein
MVLGTADREVMCNPFAAQLPCNQTILGWRILLRAALRAAAERPADPFVRAALRAAAERSDPVRREAARFA